MKNRGLSFLEIPSREGGGGWVENHPATTVVRVLVRQSDESRGVRNLLPSPWSSSWSCSAPSPSLACAVCPGRRSPGTAWWACRPWFAAASHLANLEEAGSRQEAERFADDATSRFIQLAEVQRFQEIRRLFLDTGLTSTCQLPSAHRFSYSRQILIFWLGDQDMSWLCGLSGLWRQTCFWQDKLPRQTAKKTKMKMP